MTRTEVQAMTNAQLRLTIAELRGWKIMSCSEFYHQCNPAKYSKDDPHFSRYLALINPDGVIIASTEHHNKERLVQYTTNWPNDLNACHEMECSMNFEQVKRYAHHLSLLSERDEGTGLLGVWHATARQRCEAFVLAMITPGN
jgi:hypothetical protein